MCDESDALIEVADKGVGIPPEDQARIFERFYRGAGASRQGFGLGLAIARQLVSGQRGRIELESVPGVGSTFRIRLPLLRDPVESDRLESTRWFSRKSGAAAAPGVHAGVETR